MEKIIKIGGVELTTPEIENALKQGKNYIIHFRSIYSINYSNAQNLFYGTKIYTSPDKLPLIARGRFIFSTAEYINNLLDFKLLNV